MKKNHTRNTHRKAPRGKGLIRSLHSLIRRILRANDGDILRDTIEDVLEADAKISTIELEERLMLSNILKLRQKSVLDAMIPRVDIIAVDLNTPLEEVAKLMAKSKRSRIPVYKGNLDNVVGVVHVRDLLNCMLDKSAGKCGLIKIMRELPIVAPGMKILDLLRQMRASRSYMALVVDEFGGIDGLVTIEDLAEEVIGDIEDEFDIASPREIINTPDGSIIADARMLIEDFTAETGIVFKESTASAINSIGGLVFSLAGRVPQKGEVLKYDTNLEFEILDADANRVKSVKISKKA